MTAKRFILWGIFLAISLLEGFLPIPASIEEWIVVLLNFIAALAVGSTYEPEERPTGFLIVIFLAAHWRIIVLYCARFY